MEKIVEQVMEEFEGVICRSIPKYKKSIEEYRQDLLKFFRKEEVDLMEDNEVYYLLCTPQGRPRKYQYDNLEERRLIYNNHRKIFNREKYGRQPRQDKIEGESRKEMIKRINRKHYLKRKLRLQQEQEQQQEPEQE
jgi:hypothetical protein